MKPNPSTWSLEECHEEGIFNASYMITKPDSHWPSYPDERNIVCRFPTGLGPHSTQHEDAEFILRACQSHALLVDACLAAIELINDGPQKGGVTWTIGALRQALESAGHGTC